MDFQNPRVPHKPKPKEEGCKVKIKRDKLGRIIGYETNAKCTPKELDMLKERQILSEE